MMTKHSYQGKELPKSIVFIGACNPYRMIINDEVPNGLKIKGTKDRKLVYTVNPLPHSLLNFVFNFGNLSKEDEESYIRNMIVNPIESFYWIEIKKNKEKENNNGKSLENYLNKKNFSDYLKLKKIASGSIIKAQDYIRTKNDVSSVSLREIRRFGIFYNFFVEYLRNKKKIFGNMRQNEYFEKIDEFYKDLTDFEIYKYSINLSIYVCYYLRLTKKEFREEFSKIMFDIFEFDFKKVPQKEQEYILDNIEIKEGIAKNRALLENIFTLFVCVISKVPLFIVGKPGCSKSLSVQLLFKSMKGESSENNLFHTLPKLIINSYQGSMASTSEGVLSIFKKARMELENEKKDLSKIISMVYFDEMGLAEHSLNNPLKVIHSELEYDLNEGKKKIAFVGISNWLLDASKMNRGLYLSIPQPDLEDLKSTAQTIAESYNMDIGHENKYLFEALATTYFEYKKELAKNYPIKEDFHGTRDFYYLIKNAMSSLLKKLAEGENMELDEHIKENIGIDSLERNFGGIEFDNKKSSLEIVKSKFKEKFENCPIGKKYDVLKRIKESINDKESRYLLLITKSSLSNYLLNSILKTLKKDSIFYIGSGFKKEQYSEEYILKILNKVQIQMENKSVLLLSELEPVYPSLYDLFNQNFTVVSKKNFARIGVGNTNNTFSFVNDDFKCIILVDQNEIEKEEIPFLNRFEKHIISFDYLLNEEQSKTAEEIYQIIQDLSKENIIQNDLTIPYDIGKLLVNCDKEEIKGIVYSKLSEFQNEGKKLQLQDLQDLVLEKICLTLPQDIILLMKYSGFEQKYNNISDKIINYYQKGEHNNLYNFIRIMKNEKNVIYTFTSIDEPLLQGVLDDFQTEMFGKINKNNIKDIQISSFSSENELESFLEEIYLDDKNKNKIIIFKFNPYETDIMNYINFFIENYLREKNYEEETINRKAFIFSVHMNRIFKADTNDPKKKKYINKNKMTGTISYLSEFYQIFIDNLNGENISLLDLIRCNEENLFRKCLKLENEFMKNIYSAFSYFTYDFIINVPYLKKDNYSLKIIKFLNKEEELTKLIINNILRQKSIQRDILGEILKNNYFSRDDIGIISIIQKYLSQLFSENLTQFVFKSEKDHFLSTIIFNQFYKNKDIIIEDENENEEINLSIYNSIIKKQNNNNNNEEQGIENQEQYFMGNQLMKKLIEFYFQTLDICSIPQFNNKIQDNKISLLFGLKLPGMKVFIDSFRNYIKNELNKKYFENEKNIKYINIEDENYYNQLKNCQDKIKNYQKNIETEITKNELFQKLIECQKIYKEDAKQFYEWLMDDYYLVFLSDIFHDIKNSFYKLDEYINILKKLLNIRFSSEIEKEKDELISLFAKKILWLESYSQYISILLSIYQKMSINENNLFIKINNIIDNNEIKYEISVRSPEYTKEINESFFLIMESLLKIITSDLDLYKNLKGQEFYVFLNSLKDISEDAFRINEDLYLFSKEVFAIKEFLAIQEGLNKVNKSNLDNILYILQILSKHTEFTKNLIEDETDYKDLCINIENLYEFLKKSFENTDKTNYYTELVLNIFEDEIKKISNDNYRKKLIDITLNDQKLIYKSYPLISFVLNNLIDINIENIINNLENIKNSKICYWESIEKTNSDCLNEIILSIFENQFSLYFESIEQLSPNKLEQYFGKYFEDDKVQNKTFFLFDKSLDLFKNCLNFLETLFNNKSKDNNERINNELLCKLYCISYIKMYLFKCIYFIHYDNQEFIDFSEIVKVIEGESKNNFRKMIKIYVFKIFFYLFDENYYYFSNYNYPNHQITFFEELKEKFNDKNDAILNYYLIPSGEEFQKYQEEAKEFESYKSNEFNKELKKFKKYIENHGIDIFYTVSSNIIVSNLAYKNYTKNSNIYQKYSSFAKSLFDSHLKISEITRKLFLLFSNEDEFNTTMKLKLLNEEGLTEIDPTTFEILLYALRICLQTTNLKNPKDHLFSQLISKDCKEKLKQNCLPGNNPLNNIYVINYFKLEDHLNKLPSNVGAYVCSCGLYYSIAPNGFPSVESQCYNCNNKIGYDPDYKDLTGSHGIAKRPGHYRIFKDQEQKKSEFGRYGENEKNCPNMLLKDYKNEIICPIIDNLKYGISKISKIMFEKRDLVVRKLSCVGYRLLNFVLYSHLFYSNCLGFINNENMKDYLCDGMTCIKMLVKNWNLLKESLYSKNIYIIQIFMNLIFNKLTEKLKNCKEMKTIEERDKFEEDIEKLLEESYKEYKEYSKTYLKINQESLQLDKYNMKSLIYENNEIEDYNEESFPFYKFFFMSTYPSKKSFINELKEVIDYKIKYPLLANYINNDIDQLNLLKYLPDFNKFVNFMIDTYSYKISREEASKRILEDEDIYRDNQQNFQKIFKSFKNIWKKLKPYATKFESRNEMPSIDLNENKSLAYFLNDDGEIGKGMYIAAAYEYFIDLQNNFLDKLIEPLKQNGILHHYVKNFEKTIDIQKAKKTEVLNFDKINSIFIRTIYDNCKRNIFNEEYNNINFRNYKQYIYDFDSIEKYLGDILLPGIVKFNDINTLKFVTFNYEGFRGNKSNILYDFSLKYKQKPLSLENKQAIYDSIKDNLQDKRVDLSKILFSIQLLIYYLTQDVKNEKDDIKKIIDDLPEYVNLSRECKEFFDKITLKVEEILDVYSYFELLCFKPLIDKLGEKFKKKIDEEKSKNILNLFIEKKLKVINKKNLSSACRKIISRYLVSTRNDEIFNENNKIDLYLDREEIWPKSIWKDENKIKEDLEILRKEELTLGDCYELYNLLGGDESEVLEGIIIKKEQEYEENSEDDSDEDIKIVKRHKKK